MRLLYFSLFLSSTAIAQVPTKPTLPQNSLPGLTLRQDSLPTGIQMPMPTLRPRNDFYRRPGDNPGVVRATLDNMPVLVSGTTSVPMPTHGRQPRKRKNE